MTDKQITITTCPYQGDCSISGCNRNDDDCFIKQLFEERYKADKQIVKLNKTIEAKEQECEKYEQTLTEVRKIAQGVRNYLKYPAPKDVRYEMDIILQKISECEVK